MTPATLDQFRRMERWHHGTRIDEPVLYYYDVPSNTVPIAYGPFATIEEATAYAKSQVRPQVYHDHRSHTRAWVELRRAVGDREIDAFDRAVREPLDSPEPLSPCIGDVVSSIEIFLSASELDDLVARHD